MKAWWKSKTVWLNLGALGLAGAAQNISELHGLLPANYYQIAAFAIPIANGIVRFVTTQGVYLKKPNA